ncbi:Na+/H+ antiporter subunit E [Paenibacillus sp. MY03]|jgi:multicomponent Na+:H+ antiporter subunit E|uniref:Cation:proton antiporter n=1 Tax=Paenibacillus agaridevorans TaxID=171404 RepID=A0A2R5EXT8_9BACL|nr:MULTISPECIES: Na+/H+ antiporter subunit E [Paenibacillus]OUS69356.1 Na+/H+ antiporter subunit E [Paenibacillus sp. MY03]QNK57129.1 Na+/H+ antiporter subunit E [Paenibacillus sp. PAMC21692]GBG10935.1 cation:proton antiporter [Paenibacillus agaridevorans]
MTLQILLNLLIAAMWMMLHDTWNMLTFAIGFVLGAIILFGMRRFFPAPFYGRKFWFLLKLGWLFSIELLVSSIVAIEQIIRPRLNIQPGVFRMQTRMKTEWELSLLANLMTLTPGSVVMEIAPEDGLMYVHAMDVPRMKKGIIRTKDKFEDVIIEVMR